LDLKVISKKKNYEEVMAESCMVDLSVKLRFYYNFNELAGNIRA
jgi:hypothetical protein